MPTTKNTTDNAPLQVADPEEARKTPITSEDAVMVTHPRSPRAEQYRTLRNSIVALNPESAPRTVVITSALKGEGKTVTSINLAMALAEMPNTRVLIVDANLHAPGAEEIIGMPRRQGLSELLSGRLSLDQAVRSLSVAGVAILGAGAAPKNPSELLASDRMKIVLSQLKQRFNYVLLDAPEALAISDASLLGAIADGVLLVVRLSTTPRQYVEQTHTMLETLGGNVLGTCVTGVAGD
ncbi:MAG: CpsD/CapB family tyrosine-protein kinase [Planctomycetes bacterium]|nr:CpsD/CapB family tyrosine-protein kinase [Planctomycetota bacterium]